MAGSVTHSEAAWLERDARLGQEENRVLGLRGLGLSASRTDGFNPQHNLLIIPTLQRWKLRPHSGYAVALALRDTGLWIRRCRGFLFHLGHRFRFIFQLAAKVKNLGDFICKISISGIH